MGEHYVFTFKGSAIDAAGMLEQHPFVTMTGGNHDDGEDGVAQEQYEARTAKRSVAISVAQILVAEDVPFNMTKE